MDGISFCTFPSTIVLVFIGSVLGRILNWLSKESLPAFIAAFTQGSRITADEAEAIRQLIDRAEE